MTDTVDPRDTEIAELKAERKERTRKFVRVLVRQSNYIDRLLRMLSVVPQEVLATTTCCKCHLLFQKEDLPGCNQCGALVCLFCCERRFRPIGMYCECGRTMPQRDEIDCE